MTTRYTLELHLRPGVGWTAKINDPEIARLFGTDELATGFTAKAAPDEVLCEITRLNPHADVSLAPGILQ